MCLDSSMRHRLLAPLLVLGLLTAACTSEEPAPEAAAPAPTAADDGGDTDPTDPDEAGTEDTETEDADETVDGSDETGTDAGEVGDGTFVPGDCPFEVEIDIVVDCGVVLVPESRTGLSDATIELAVAILRTPAPDPAPDPVVYLSGGPGGAALAEYAAWHPEPGWWTISPILSSRDLILVDQRGTGYSLPSLDCLEDESEEDCYQRLVDEGVTPAAYSTPENAADIAAIRVALGLEEWNIHGSSYGTRLGLVTLANHPEGVRSLVLAGVYPPNKVPAYHDFMGNSFRVIDELRAACAEDEACDGTYGDVGQLLVDALRVTQEGPSPSTAQDLWDRVFSSLYAMPGVAAVPLALQLAADGAIDDALALLDDPEAGFSADRARGRSVDPSDDSDGLFNSVECREEQGFTDLEVLEAQAEEYLQAGVDELLVSVLLSGAQAGSEATCQLWDSGRATADERAPVVSDVPTLLLSGGFDPITPPSWGDLAAETLSSSTHVVIPNLSHGLVDVNQCVDDIVIAFLADPGSELETACVDEIPPPAFLLP
jgi:pimeloyl-ACP methyl ester carboxylesterase